MAIRALIHIFNEDAVLCELDEMPKPNDQFIRVRNATKRDGKPLELVDERATSLAFPWSRVTFVEFFDEETARESVVGFFRESRLR